MSNLFFLGIPNDPQLRNRVIGGEAVEPHTMPWQVGLTLKGNPYIQAGAVIICPTFVIGAAHEPFSVTSELEVIVGAHHKTISKEAIRKNVMYRHMMPQYDPEAHQIFACQNYKASMHTRSNIESEPR